LIFKIGTDKYEFLFNPFCKLSEIVSYLKAKQIDFDDIKFNKEILNNTSIRINELGIEDNSLIQLIKN
jgi:hypothetical protein